MLTDVALAELLLCWIAWWCAFIRPRKQASAERTTARAPGSRWGIVLEAVGFFLVWARVRPVGFEKSPLSLIVAMVLAPASVLLVWAATRHLGKQWRIQAALTERHELIQTGPYRWVRHPIYASMFGMLLATGCVWTWWPMFLGAIVFFLVGTEIRIRAEDGLLAERFQDVFTAYRAHVPAYIPFVR